MSDEDKFDGPLDHVPREKLPWREDRLTECGRPESDVKGDLVTVTEVKRRIDKMGKKRASFTVCMTCVERVRYRTETWEEDPAGVLHRYLERTGGRFAGHGDVQRERMNRELHAIAALIAEHREEFDGYLSGVQETVSLDEVRARRSGRRRSS